MAKQLKRLVEFFWGILVIFGFLTWKVNCFGLFFRSMELGTYGEFGIFGPPVFFNFWYFGNFLKFCNLGFVWSFDSFLDFRFFWHFGTLLLSGIIFWFWTLNEYLEIFVLLERILGNHSILGHLTLVFLDFVTFVAFGDFSQLGT